MHVGEVQPAGRAGIPQIISLCSVNYMTPAKSKYKPEFHERRKYDLDKYRTWIRFSPAELREVAAAFVQKLNPAKGPVKIMVPLKGWCSLDVPGSPTFDLQEDASFIAELRAGRYFVSLLCPGSFPGSLPAAGCWRFASSSSCFS